MRDKLVNRVWATAAAFAMMMVGVVVATPAAAAPPDPLPRAANSFTADRLPTVQINGVVWATEVVGTKVFAGGSFTRARPAGAAAGTNETVRNNLLAFDLATGALDTSFAPDLNGQVLGIAASPDKSRLYVVGDFTSANGQARRRVAAYDTATGALVAGFNPVGVNSRARSVAATATAVYVGGGFAGAGAAPRNNLAAFSPTNGALLPWNPSAELPVWALATPPDGSAVFAGGQFTTINGQQAYGLAKLNPSTGVLDTAWRPVVRNAGNDAAVGSLRIQSNRIYGTTWHFGPGGNLEGVFKATLTDGAVDWLTDCHGDMYSSYLSQGTVYVAGHSHYCGNMGGGHPQYSTWRFQHAQAFSDTVTGEILNDVHGYYNWHGLANGPAMVNWLPEMAIGSYTGQYQAGWSVTGNDDYIVYGGEFPRVNGLAQQGLVRFGKRPVAPGAEGPRFVGNTFVPQVVARSSTTARLTWPAAYDRDDRTLTYRVIRNGSQRQEVTADSNWWTLPALGYVDSGLTPGATYRYQVLVMDPGGNQVWSSTATITMPTDQAATNAYTQAVLDASPDLYWPLNDARSGGGLTLLDRAGFDDGVAGSDVTSGQPGAIVGDSAVVLNGANGRTYAKGSRFAPDTFSLQVWINTTTTRGGRILGFSDLQQGESGHRDRHLYMANDGRILFGVRATDGSNRTIASSQRYNNGQWHMVTATLGPSGMVLYVDGVRVARRADVTLGERYLGQWRLAGDNLGGWPSAPSTSDFTGAVDEIAVYPSVLGQDTVLAQYAASGRTTVLPPAPTDTYGAAVYADDPDLYWRLAETSGTTALDSGRSLNHGTYYNGVTLGAQGVLQGNGAASFDGSNDVVFSNAQFSNPTLYSLEAWFRTTTTAGGKIIGFGNNQTTTSTNYDRHVYMLPNGHVVFGVWTGFANTAETTAPYNDGGWHHVVATQSSAGMKLYVDGDLVASNPQTASQAYDGYWRVGGDSSWAGAPFFNGVVDEAAVYGTELSLDRIRAHFQAAGGALNQAPTAEFSWSADQRRVTFSGTGTDPDGTVIGWAWDFGDSVTSTAQNPVHVFDSDGDHAVTLTVTDNRGATVTVTHTVTVQGPPGPTDSYGSAVFSDGPRLYWRMGESTGTRAQDVAGGGSHGTYWNAPTLGQPGALPIADTSVLFDGSNDFVSSDDSFTNPTVYSLEAWFRTTSTTGGKIIGLGANRTGLSGNYDRHVYMLGDGKLVFGVWTGQMNTITTAASYNDGEWHHLVASQSSRGMRLYVDGVQRGANPQTQAESYTGYWKVGGDTSWGGDNWFDGSIDEVAVYLKDLGDQRVAAHFAATQPVPNQPPTASFTVIPSDLTVQVDAGASTDPDGQIVGYAWEFGDGGTASGETGSHAYATPGTFTVTLTVTDDDGSTDTETRSVTVGPPNVPPTASFTWAATGRQASFTSTSADGDGTVTSQVWDFGDGQTGSGASAQHTYAADGTYTVVLTVTDDDGATDSDTQSVTVAAPAQLASDAFERTVANGWGSADVGGAWTISGASTNYAVGSGVGRLQMTTGASRSAYLNAVSARDVEMTGTLSHDKAGSGGGIYTSLIVRRAGTSDYRAVVRVTATATEVQLRRMVNGTETTLATAAVPGGALPAEQALQVRLRVTGAPTTSLQAKVWRSGQPEPAAWTAIASDTTAALQTAGAVGFYSYLSSSATNAPVVTRFDDVTVVNAQG